MYNYFISIKFLHKITNKFLMLRVLLNPYGINGYADIDVTDMEFLRDKFINYILVPF